MAVSHTTAQPMHMAKPHTRAPAFRRNRNPITWFLRHVQMSLSSLGRLSRNPLSTAMTAAVIGIAIALPAGLHLLVDNVRNLAGTWHGGTSISLFLQREISDSQAEQVRHTVSLRNDVANAELITRQQALDEFRQLSGFSGALDLLDENPLPAVVLVQPTDRLSDARAARQLADELQRYKEIELAQVDLKWVKRLEAITDTVERGVMVLSVLLAAAVLLIIGNTIRLEIQNRHDEIEITKLVGATDAFIRRPFLYEGIWYGLVGAIVALLLIFLSMWLLQGPVHRLAGLYESSFSLALLDFGTLAAIVVFGPLLGLAGAWLAVGKHLRRIVPE